MQETRSSGLRQCPTHSRCRLEVGNFGFNKKMDYTICVAKTKGLISCAITTKLICGFGFADADCWISDAVAHSL